MFKKLDIFIVDDHPFIIDAYINLITSSLEEFNLTFFKSSDTRDAFSVMNKRYLDGKNIDLAIFDINIPKYEEEGIYDGCDLALEFKKRFPKSKILIISMHSDGCVLNRILKDIEVDAIINKSDISSDTFSNFLDKVLKDEFTTSETMLHSINKLNKLKFKFDNIDLEIIRLIGKGIKTKDLPNYLEVSLSAIEKRKKIIKFYLLDGKSGNDKKIIEKAKLLRLI